jgi:hypothetical protein
MRRKRTGVELKEKKEEENLLVPEAIANLLLALLPHALDHDAT